MAERRMSSFSRGQLTGLFVGAFVAMTTAWVVAGWVVVELAQSPVGGFDQDLSAWMEGHRSERLTRMAGWASLPADTAIKIVVMLALAIVMRVAFARWRDWLILLAALLLEVCVYGAASRIVGRPRPDVEHLASETAQSWPSGHVAAATTLYIGLALVVSDHTNDRRVIKGAFIVAIAVVCAMCVARLYLGAHFLTDVAAGIALGMTSLAVTRRVLGGHDVSRRT